MSFQESFQTCTERTVYTESRAWVLFHVHDSAVPLRRTAVDSGGKIFYTGGCSGLDNRNCRRVK